MSFRSFTSKIYNKAKPGTPNPPRNYTRRRRTRSRSSREEERHEIDAPEDLAYGQYSHDFEATVPFQNRDEFLRLVNGDGKESIDELGDLEWNELFHILNANNRASSRKAGVGMNETVGKSDDPTSLEIDGPEDQAEQGGEEIDVNNTPSGIVRPATRYAFSDPHNDRSEAGEDNGDQKSEQGDELRDKEEEVETARHERRPEPRQNLESHTLNDGNLVLENKTLKLEIQRLEEERNIRKKDLSERRHWNLVLAKKLVELSRKTHSLEETMKTTEKENKDLKEYRRKAAAALTELRQHAAKSTVDDEKIKRDYGELVYTIENWTSNYCCATASRSLSKEDQQRVGTLTRMPERYLQDKQLRTLLIQSLIMKRLVADVLSFSKHAGLLWAGDLSESLRTLGSTFYYEEPNSTHASPQKESVKPQRLKDWSAWKAHTASLLAVDVAQINHLIDEYTNNLWMEVRSFVTASKGTKWEELRDVVRKAVRLDEELFKSQAIFVFGTWAGSEEILATKGFRFNSDLMKSPIGFEEAEEDMTAEILLAPCLRKIGTANGDGFDKTMYLEKWMVVCTESRLKKKRN